MSTIYFTLKKYSFTQICHRLNKHSTEKIKGYSRILIRSARTWCVQYVLKFSNNQADFYVATHSVLFVFNSGQIVTGRTYVLNVSAISLKERLKKILLHLNWWI